MKNEKKSELSKGDGVSEVSVEIQNDFDRGLFVNQILFQQEVAEQIALIRALRNSINITKFIEYPCICELCTCAITKSRLKDDY